MRELATNTRLHPNYLQMLAYVNMPILLLWEGGGGSDGVGFINVLALLQQFQGKSLGGKRTAVFLHAAVGERWRRALPFSFFHPFLFWAVRYSCPLTAHATPLGQSP